MLGMLLVLGVPALAAEELRTGDGLAIGLDKSKSFTNVHDRCVHKGDKECSFLSTW